MMTHLPSSRIWMIYLMVELSKPIFSKQITPLTKFENEAVVGFPLYKLHEFVMR